MTINITMVFVIGSLHECATIVIFLSFLSTSYSPTLNNIGGPSIKTTWLSFLMAYVL